MVKFLKVRRKRVEEYEKLNHKPKYLKIKNYIFEMGSWRRGTWWRWLIILPLYIPLNLIYLIICLFMITLSFMATGIQYFQDFTNDTTTIFYIGKIEDEKEQPKTKFKEKIK